MILYLQPNLWSCLPTSFGMVMGMTPGEMFEAIGHDGSDIVWPELDDPACRRGFHVMECVRVALDRLFTPIELDPDPHSVPFEGAVPHRVDMDAWFVECLGLYDGVLLGVDGNNRHHAVAWNAMEKKVYDPTGYKYDISQFKILTFYGVT